MSILTLPAVKEDLTVTLLVNARKYITIDQLMVYRIYYESVVIKGQNNAQACESVRDIDKRRDGSAVKKVIDGLNSRFETLFQSPLLAKSDEGVFSATDVGKEIYDYARRISDATNDLERRLDSFLPGASSVACWIRSDLLKARTGWLRELRGELSDQLDIQIHTMQTGTLFDAIRSNLSTFVIDQLFVTDKRNINSNDLFYYPISLHSLLIGITPSYKELLAKVRRENDKEGFIEVADISTARLAFTRNAFQFRAALSLANLAIMPKSFLDPEVIDHVHSYFPNSNIEGEVFSDLAFSKFIDKPHAVIGDAMLIRDAREQLGQDYEIAHLTSKGVEQYFHEAVIMRRELQASQPGTGMARLVEVFNKERDEFFRLNKKPDRPEWVARIKSNDAMRFETVPIFSDVGK